MAQVYILPIFGMGILLLRKKKPDMVAHTCNLSTWEAGQKGYEFKASLGYRAKPCLKKSLNCKTVRLKLTTASHISASRFDIFLLCLI